MFCTKCGKELYEGDLFCAYCGAEVRRHKPEGNEEVIFNPPFKLEAQKRTNEILKATEQSDDANAEEKKRHEAIAFDWNLDGFPTAGPKKTEDIAFNWDSVIERKNTGKSPAEPNIEKIAFKNEDFSWQEVLHEKTANATESTTPFMVNEPEKVMSTEELEKEIFGTATIGEEGAKEERDNRFYTFNKKNDAFDELLEKERERMRSMEEAYNRQLTDMDYTWVPEVFPPREERKTGHAEQMTRITREDDDKSDYGRIDGRVGNENENIALSEAKGNIRVVHISQPILPQSVDLTKCAAEDTRKTKTDVAEEASLRNEDSQHDLLSGKDKEKLRYSDIFPKAEVSNVDNDGNHDAGTADYGENRPTKKRRLLKALVTVLLLALAIEGGALAVKFFAPESKVSAMIDSAIFKATDLFIGSSTPQNADGDDDGGLVSADDGKAAYFSNLVIEKATDIKSIGSVSYNPEMTYISGKEYSFAEIPETEAFIDAEWADAGVTYGEKLLEAVIKYYDGWIDTNLESNLMGINTLEIGEIRTGTEGFYVLCEVTYATADGEELSQYQTVFVKISNGLMVINEIKEERF